MELLLRLRTPDYRGLMRREVTDFHLLKTFSDAFSCIRSILTFPPALLGLSGQPNTPEKQRVACTSRHLSREPRGVPSLALRWAGRSQTSPGYHPSGNRKLHFRVLTSTYTSFSITKKPTKQLFFFFSIRIEPSALKPRLSRWNLPFQWLPCVYS